MSKIYLHMARRSARFPTVKPSTAMPPAPSNETFCDQRFGSAGVPVIQDVYLLCEDNISQVKYIIYIRYKQSLMPTGQNII